MKCPNCGAEIAPGDVFCGNCGKMVLPEESTAPPPPPPVPPPPPADRTRKAMTIGIILVIAGVVLCLAGVGIGAVVAFAGQGEDLSLAESVTGSVLCCMTPLALPGVIMAVIGGVVWFVWGRSKG
ncbi:MAG: zinc ribbon domain-containing protein [Anaerolineae bacterium]|jgi:heme/copper-type cytochrome/quinol oxidase subunit 2|nr:zinc ribbon domain-containing protein [Anaerolineae bacterium]MDH7475577.1 zinc ribbon domain-containing protein [Anaerolineae bacterium]